MRTAWLIATIAAGLGMGQDHPVEVVEQKDPGAIDSVVFGPRSRWLAARTASGQVQVYDLSSRLLIREAGDSASSVAAHPTEDHLVWGSGRVLVRIDVGSGRELWRVPISPERRRLALLRFTSDASRLVGVTFSYERARIRISPLAELKIWDAITGREISSATLKDCPSPAALSAGGEWLACSIESILKPKTKRKSFVIDTATGRIFRNDLPISIKAIDKTSARALGYDDQGLVLFDLTNGKPVKTWPTVSKAGLFTADGKRAILAGYGMSRDPAIDVVDAADGHLLSEEKNRRVLHGIIVGIAPDGDRIVTNAESALMIASLSQPQNQIRLGKRIDRPEFAQAAAAWTSNGRMFAGRAPDGSVALWDVANGSPLPFRLPFDGNFIGPLSGEAFDTRLQLHISDRSHSIASGAPAEECTSDDRRFRLNLPPDVLDLSAGCSLAPGGMRVVVAGTGPTRNPGLLSRMKRLGSSAPIGEGYWKRTTPLVIFDLKSSRAVPLLEAKTGSAGTFPFPAEGMIWSPDGKYVAGGGAVEGGQGILHVWDAATGRETSTHAGHVTPVGFTPDSRFLIVTEGALAGWGGQEPFGLVFLNATDGWPAFRLDEAAADGRLILFAPAGKTIVAPTRSGDIGFWERNTGVLLGRLRAMSGGDWLITTPSGAFDGSPGGWREIAWRDGSGKTQTGPGELYFNEFFRPGLLANLLEGRSPGALRPITELDRRQPAVSISAKAEGRLARVFIDVVEARTPDGATAGSGARDLHLFRNGSLVKAWRDDLSLSSKGTVRYETSVKLVAGENRLVAYAFNRDNIKSSDASFTLQGSGEPKKGAAYVLSIGINKYSQSEFDLNYAAPDARAVTAGLLETFGRTGDYASVTSVELLDGDATRANVVAALEILAGKRRASQPDTPASLARLRGVEPEDALIFYFAGHGFANEGKFYLVPHDLGYAGPRRELRRGIAEVAAHSISDRDLELLLEDIDAQHTVLIIDACQSGQAIQSDDPRQGPMNSAGLAQLAYEKGIYILAAAQAYQAALETARLGHGYLTYALVEEGLRSVVADRAPADHILTAQEWIEYAAERVPRLQIEALDQAREEGRTLTFSVWAPGEPMLQTPRVFAKRDAVNPQLVIARQ